MNKIKTKQKELMKLIDDLRYYNKGNNIDKAFDILQMIKEHYSYVPLVRFEEALLYEKIHDIDKAIEILDELITQNKKNKNAAMSEYIRILIYYSSTTSNSLLGKVAEYCEYLIAFGYKEKLIEYYYGRYFEKIYRYEEAELHYRKAHDLGFLKAESRIANMALKMNKKQRYNSEINSVINKNAKSLVDLEVKIKNLMNKDKISEISKVLKQFEKKINNCYNSNRYVNDSNIYYLIKNYLKIGLLDDALNVFEQYEYHMKNDSIRIYTKAKLELAQGNYDKAIKYFEEVIELNGDEVFNAYSFLAKIANYNKDYISERYYYEKMEKISNNESGNVTVYNIYLDIRQNNIEKARQRFKTLSNEFIRVNLLEIRQLNAYLGYEVTLLDRNFYSIKQIVDYNKNAAIEHILRHTDDSNLYKESGNFKSDINIEELYDELLIKIANMKPTCFDLFDHYIVSYPNVGFCNENTVDYVEIVVVPNTKNIITMFPIASNNIFAKNVIRREKNEYSNESTKVKRKSQVEKFYAKYGKEG